MTAWLVRCLPGWQLLILALGLASCATVDATSTQYVGAATFPPTNPASVPTQ